MSKEKNIDYDFDSKFAEDYALNDENLNTYKMKLDEIVKKAFLAGIKHERECPKGTKND